MKEILRQIATRAGTAVAGLIGGVVAISPEHFANLEMALIAIFCVAVDIVTDRMTR